MKPAHPDPRISTRGLDVVVAVSLSRLMLRFALVEKAEAAAVDVGEDDAMMNSIDDECKPPLFSFLSDADR